MIDISKLKYRIYLLRENGEQLEITDISTSVNWAENEGELAQSVSLGLANILYKGTRISSIAKPKCYIIINAEYGGVSEEVARGRIEEWTVSRTMGSDDVDLQGYDCLYDFQTSQDNRYIKAGTNTKTAITDIFADWGVPIAKYEGPSVSHAKTLYKNEYISDMVLDLLETAHKHGASECIVRASKGMVSIIPKASNKTVYCFEEEENLETTKYKISTSDMITVVKVVATEDEEGRQPVEAVINGKIEYGHRQKIYVRDKDDTLATATASAREILKEEGDPIHTMNVKAPDVPMVRRYDKVKIKSRAYTGYMVVLSVQHDAISKTMNMSLAKYIETPSLKSSEKRSSAYKVGDVVDFAGGNHYYTSHDENPRGGKRTSGLARITFVAEGTKHPYHLMGGAYCNVGGSSNVYGWVDKESFS